MDSIFPSSDPYPYQVTGGVAQLQLSAWPLVAIDSVVENKTVLTDGASYLSVPEHGQLVRLGASGVPIVWQAVPIVVKYSAGYNLPDAAPVSGAADLPPQLEDACSRLVWARYSERRRDPFIKSEIVEGVGRTDYIVGDPRADGAAFPPDVIDLIDNFRVPVAT